jgi:uncharacterized protein (DUF58 family)
MRTRESDPSSESILDKRRLQAIGVLLPIKLKELSFLPGRHPLGRAGEGMRFLRSRPFEPGEDNPRDIDKFSTHGDYWVNESESEVQASIYLLCDISASMAFPQKAAVRNLAMMQLTYSLWRACDRVRAIFYSREGTEEFAERNLKTQLEKLGRRLGGNSWQHGLDVTDAIETANIGSRGKKNDIIFLISDFSPVTLSEEQFSVQHWRSMMRTISGDIVPVIISFRLSYEMQGMCKLWDPERQRQRLTLLTATRIDAINTREKQRVEKLEGFFRKLGLDFLVLRQERDVYPQLARLTGLRRRRKT